MNPIHTPSLHLPSDLLSLSTFIILWHDSFSETGPRRRDGSSPDTLYCRGAFIPCFSPEQERSDSILVQPLTKPLVMG